MAKRRRQVSTASRATKQDYSNRRKNIVKYGVPTAVGVGGGYALMNTLGGGSSSSSTSGKESGKGSGKGTTGNSETGEDGSSNGDGNSDGSDSNIKSRVVEVPIDNYDDAMDFANREWNKIKREDGRQLDVQVQGSCEWRVGEWCKVYLPHFDVDGYMYVTRVSQSSEGGEWGCNLTLVDYPPGWGKEQIEKNDEEDEENSEDSGEGDGTSDGTSDGTGDGSSSDGGDGESSNSATVDGVNFNSR